MKKKDRFGKGKKMGKPGTKPRTMGAMGSPGKKPAQGPSKDSIQELTNNINKYHNLSENAEGRCADHAIKAGRYLLKLKLAVKRKKDKDGKAKKFAEYMAEHFPHIQPRTYQRAMNLAERLSEAEANTLVFLGQARLLALITVARKMGVTVSNFLEAKGIALPDDPDDDDELRDCRTAVDNLFKDSSKGKKNPPMDEKDKGSSSTDDADGDDAPDDDDPDHDEDDAEDDDKDPSEDKEELPSEPLETLSLISKESNVIKRMVEHFEGQRKRLRKAPVNRRHGRILNNLIQTLEANLEKLRSLRKDLER